MCRFGDGYFDADIYTMDNSYEPPAKRARRKRLSPPHILAANDRHSRNQLRQLIIHNFRNGDYYLTPTYAGKLPTFGDAQRQLSNYITRLKRLYQKHGTELRAIYVTEGGRVKNDEGDCTRVHHHLCISGGVPREEIEKAWKGRQDDTAESRRGFCNCSMIQSGDGERGCERIAEYMSKSRTKTIGKGLHRWNATRNIKRPEETINDNKFSRKRTNEIIELVKAQKAAQQENTEALRRILEARYNMEIIDVISSVNPVTGRVYISARFRRKQELSEHKSKKRQYGAFPAMPLFGNTYTASL